MIYLFIFLARTCKFIWHRGRGSVEGVALASAPPAHSPSGWPGWPGWHGLALSGQMGLVGLVGLLGWLAWLAWVSGLALPPGLGQDAAGLVRSWMAGWLDGWAVSATAGTSHGISLPSLACSIACPKTTRDEHSKNSSCQTVPFPPWYLRGMNRSLHYC